MNSPRATCALRPPRAAASFLILLAAGLLAGCGADGPAPFSGYVETEPVRVASPVAGRLLELPVRRGQDVKAGAPLFVLEQTAEQAGVREAQARVAQAEAQAQDLGKGGRPDELAAARAALAQARAALVQSESDLKRQRELAQSGFISPSGLTAVQARRDADAARVRQLEAELRVAELGGRSDARAAAGAQTDAARAALARSAWTLDQKTVVAPAAARVDDTLFRVGEWVPAGAPVVSLLQPGAVKLRFYVPEPVLAQVRPGTRVLARCDGCAQPVAATVRYVASQAEFTPPVVYSEKQRQRLVFLVEAWPEPADGARLPAGLPVDVTVDAPRVQGAS